MPDWKICLREKLFLPVMEGHRDERAIEEMADCSWPRPASGAFWPWPPRTCPGWMRLR